MFVVQELFVLVDVATSSVAAAGVGTEFAKWLADVGKVVLGGAITLAGVLISSNSQAKQQVKRLAEEAEQARQDRIASARREIYLPMVDATLALTAVMGRLGEKGATQEHRKEIFDFQAAVARAKLVAEGKNIEMLIHLSSTAMAGYLSLVREALPIADIDSRIEGINSSIDDQLGFLREFDERHANVTGALVAMLIEERKMLVAKISSARHELAASWVERNNAHIEFTQKILPVAQKIASCSDEVMIALRLELEVQDTDEAAMRAGTAQAAAEAERLTAELLKELRKNAGA
ncbi:hypothetical protein [Xanthomonas arboricola]|uniref:hypothetical protein n=1 Tax=Xanthomonas arboricola TaxID=56448 RepID=UPI000C83526D|nr:hypothetical protein [Xanthomonas arboricola]PPU28695.1 hypothetical protein XarCFBP6762_05455 [Xanthomonas arboricola]SOT99581.1 hypothetical protein CFBP6762_02230 [Xanthomonas arboricola pv. fragariae]